MSIAVMVWPVGGAKLFLFFGYNFGTEGPRGMGVGFLMSPYEGISYDILIMNLWRHLVIEN
jgi:hypothetical protein